MILVDSSYWIELLRKRPTVRAFTKDELAVVMTCGPVIQEIFQGLKDLPETAVFRESFLRLHRLEDPVALESYTDAAEMYRLCRRKGHTPRSSVDCLIAAIAVRHSATVLHRDRDFAVIAKYTELKQRQTLGRR